MLLCLSTCQKTCTRRNFFFSSKIFFTAKERIFAMPREKIVLSLIFSAQKYIFCIFLYHKISKNKPNINTQKCCLSLLYVIYFRIFQRPWYSNQHQNSQNGIIFDLQIDILAICYWHVECKYGNWNIFYVKIFIYVNV